MWVWLTYPTAQAGLAVIAVGGIAYAGFYIAKRLRPATRIADTNVEQVAENFAEMQREGDISGDELRSIEAVLGKTQQSPSGD